VNERRGGRPRRPNGSARLVIPQPAWRLISERAKKDGQTVSEAVRRAISAYTQMRDHQDAGAEGPFELGEGEGEGGQ
jgi:hypothetical protein